MAITQKQERYARLVASGMDLHTAALEAGCKNHEAARKFVADMAKRENVQAFINELKTTHAGLQQGQTDKQETSSETEAKAVKYETPLEFLTSVFNNIGGLYTPKERITAAVALLPYTESKVAPIGKKEGEVNNAQEKSRNGRFATLSHQTDMFASEIVQ